MKSTFKLLCLTILASVVVAGCGGGKGAGEAPTITSLETHTDKALGFSIKYPTGWIETGVVGQTAVFYSAQNAPERFTSFATEGPVVAKLGISAKKLDSTSNIDELIEESKVFDKNIYSTKEPVKLGGVDGWKFTYEFDLNDGKFHGERYFATLDSTALTIVDFEAFAGAYDALRPKFEEMLASVTLARVVERDMTPDTVFTDGTPFQPSETTKSFNGDGFSLQIPDNFKKVRASAGGTLSSTKFQGDGGPADCTIQIDVIDASEQKDLNKIVDENKANYRNASPKNATVGGVEAKMLEYDASREVRGRIYFAVKGDRLYRISIFWFKPEQNLYLPAFTKVVKSIKL